MLSSTTQGNKIMPFAVEAAWVTRRWESLSKFLRQYGGDPSQDFNIAVAGLFESVRKQAPPQEVAAALQSMREKVASALNTSSTASLQAAHDLMLKCHAVADLELILEARTGDEEAHKEVISLLEGRLDIIGAYFNDKQYLLGLRRAAMELLR
jgi:serine/threonine-protein kinase ATR